MTNKRDFDSAAATWDDNPHRRALARSVADAIVKAVPLRPDMRLMDYGCGTGLVTLALQPHVAHLVAADSSEGMLHTLGNKLQAAGITNVEPVRLDLERDDWQGLPFDVIVSSMTLHHIARVDLLVRKLAGMLVDGGYLAIADLDAGSEGFHADHTGVMHHGFGVAERQELFAQASLTEIRTIEAARVQRPGAVFPVLLTVGKR